MTKDTHPKSYHLLSEWIKEQSKLSGQPPEILEKIPVENMVSMVLQTNGRVLVDWLQDHGILTGVWPIDDVSSGKVVWRWKVMGGTPTVESTNTTRKEAEERCVLEGVNRLEKR